MISEVIKETEAFGGVLKDLSLERLVSKPFNCSLYSLRKTEKMCKENELVYLSSLTQLVNKANASSSTRTDRTNTGTYSTFGTQCVYDLRKGFPLLTSKKLSFKNILLELIWFLSGNTNNNWLKERGVNIWSDWENESGELVPIYVRMWRSWVSEGIDQIQELIHTLQTDPYSRRMIVTGWDPDLLPDTRLSHAENISLGRQVLPPCHTMWQVYVEDRPISEILTELKASTEISSHVKRRLKDMSKESVLDLSETVGIPNKYLDLKLYQRSGDIFLGVPYNIASYATLMVILGYLGKALPRHFIHTFGDLHLYSNHLDQAREQLQRPVHDSPLLYVNVGDSPFINLRYFLENPYTCLTLLDYKHEALIQAPIAV